MKGKVNNLILNRYCLYKNRFTFVLEHFVSSFSKKGFLVIVNGTVLKVRTQYTHIRWVIEHPRTRDEATCNQEVESKPTRLT